MELQFFVSLLADSHVGHERLSTEEEATDLLKLVTVLIKSIFFMP